VARAFDAGAPCGQSPSSPARIRRCERCVPPHDAWRDGAASTSRRPSRMLLSRRSRIVTCVPLRAPTRRGQVARWSGVARTTRCQHGFTIHAPPPTRPAPPNPEKSPHNPPPQHPPPPSPARTVRTPRHDHPNKEGETRTNTHRACPVQPSSHDGVGCGPGSELRHATRQTSGYRARGDRAWVRHWAKDNDTQPQGMRHRAKGRDSRRKRDERGVIRATGTPPMVRSRR